mmetsp:Transcript_16646/g.25461  ORF Transcript_16646/g.25461 Transcript_16646/m.25461 type:complete len:606 (-) Transcript_16646:139-1956(-)
MVVQTERNQFIQTSQYATWNFLQEQIATEDELDAIGFCDAEEVEEAMGKSWNGNSLYSYLLVVPKRQNKMPPSSVRNWRQTYQRPPPTPSNGAVSPFNPPTATATPQIPMSNSEIGLGGALGNRTIPGHVNGFPNKANPTGKKMKRSSSSMIVPPPNRYQPPALDLNGKGRNIGQIQPTYPNVPGIRPNVHLKQLDSVPFKLANVHVRHKILHRLSRVFYGHDENLVHIGSPRQETNEQAGLDSNYPVDTQANSDNRLNLLLSDFGPFHVGLISLPEGLLRTQTSSRRVGVSLPLGVKVPQITQRNFVSTDTSWKQAEDVYLRKCVQRYGENWRIVSFMVSDLRKSPAAIVQVNLRSARQCRERWNFLNRESSGMGNMLNDVQNDASIEDTSHLVDATGVEVVLPKAHLAECQRPRFAMSRNVALMKGASSNHQKLKIPVPGYAGVGTPAVAPPNHSHSQSVQAAVASAAATGFAPRAEMWPLQVLEIADKQRASRKSASFQSQQTSRSSRHLPSSTPTSQSRHQRSNQNTPKPPISQVHNPSPVPQNQASRSPPKRSMATVPHVVGAQSNMKIGPTKYEAAPIRPSSLEVSPMRAPNPAQKNKN